MNIPKIFNEKALLAAIAAGEDVQGTLMLQTSKYTRLLLSMFPDKPEDISYQDYVAELIKPTKVVAKRDTE